ncbi:MAG: flagellar motor switch protein FliN [Chthoniobacteraceae bacterium]|jgi:flagellar motor switch protein FliN
MNNLLQEHRLETVLGVKVQLSVRLGSCQLMMRDVLDLSPGSIVQLDQRANDNVGLYINDKLIARGEVVVMEENFGIKITELVGEEEAKK